MDDIWHSIPPVDETTVTSTTTNNHEQERKKKKIKTKNRNIPCSIRSYFGDAEGYFLNLLS